MQKQREGYEPPSGLTLVAWASWILLAVTVIGGPWWARVILGFGFWFALHAARAMGRGVRAGLRSPLEEDMSGPGSLPPELADRATDALEDLCLDEVTVNSRPYWCGGLRGHAGPHDYEPMPDPTPIASMAEFERLYGPAPKGEM